jgi:outer membrane receptor for ferrienterochelin and colicins
MKRLGVLVVLLVLSTCGGWGTPCLAEEVQEQEAKGEGTQARKEKVEEYYRFDEIKVSASPTDTPVDKMAVRTIVMTDEEIKRTPARNVMDLLQYVEGIYMPLGEGSKQSFPNLTIRGLGSGYFGRNTPVLFSLNGHNLTGTWGSYFTFADLQLIPISAIERIEVVKGPYSSIYGSGALGGVINIVTKKRFTHIPEGHVEGTGGSEEHLNVEGYLAGK